MNLASLLLKEVDNFPTFPKFPSSFANLDNFATQNFSNFNHAELCSELDVYVGDQSLTEPEKKAIIQEYFGGILFEDRNNNFWVDFKIN
jgi:hypothetical protein